MSKLLDEMLGEGVTTLTMPKIALILAEFDERISKLEENKSYGGVFVDGSPTAVKDYYSKFTEKVAKGDK